MITGPIQVISMKYDLVSVGVHLEQKYMCLVVIVKGILSKHLRLDNTSTAFNQSDGNCFVSKMKATSLVTFVQFVP